MEAQTCCESYVNLSNSQDQPVNNKNTKTGNAENISSSNENEVLIIDKNSLQAQKYFEDGQYEGESNSS